MYWLTMPYTYIHYIHMYSIVYSYYYILLYSAVETMGSNKKGAKMGTKHINLTVDECTYNKMKTMIENDSSISKEVRDFMDNYVSMKELNLDEIDLRIIKSKEHDLTKEINSKIIERDALRAQISAIEKRKSKRDIDMLEKEKKRAIAANSCWCCGEIIVESSKKLNYGKKTVCYSCYMSQQDGFKAWESKLNEENE